MYNSQNITLACFCQLTNEAAKGRGFLNDDLKIGLKEFFTECNFDYIPILYKDAQKNCESRVYLTPDLIRRAWNFKTDEQLPARRYLGEKFPIENFTFLRIIRQKENIKNEVQIVRSEIERLKELKAEKARLIELKGENYTYTHEKELETLITKRKNAVLELKELFGIRN